MTANAVANYFFILTTHGTLPEYILGGEVETKLLDVRVFDEATKKSIFAKQTKKAKETTPLNNMLRKKMHQFMKEMMKPLNKI